MKNKYEKPGPFHQPIEIDDELHMPPGDIPYPCVDNAELSRLEKLKNEGKTTEVIFTITETKWQFFGEAEISGVERDLFCAYLRFNKPLRRVRK